MSQKDPFHERANILYDNLAKAYSDISHMLIRSPEQFDLTQGWLKVLKDSIPSVKAFLARDKRDYFPFFANLRDSHHKLFLLFKKSKDSDFDFGQYQASRFIYKQSNELLQYMANFDTE